MNGPTNQPNSIIRFFNNIFKKFSISKESDIKTASIAKSSLTQNTNIRPASIAAARPIERLGSLSIDISELVTDALKDTATFQRPLPTNFNLTNPYLKFIAAQRQSLGESYTNEEMAKKIRIHAIGSYSM